MTHQYLTAIDTQVVRTEGMSVPDNMAEHSVATHLDSQPLSDLGVCVMDQDVVERNVAAQVCPAE